MARIRPRCIPLLAAVYFVVVAAEWKDIGRRCLSSFEKLMLALLPVC